MFINEKKKKKNSRKSNSFSAPPPAHGVDLTGAVSAECHPHRSTRTSSLRHELDATNFK